MSSVVHDDSVAEPLDPNSGYIDAANAYAKADVPAPYATIPSWLRRCIFQVLTGREFSTLIYVYMCENKNGVSFTLFEQAMGDLGVKKRETITEALASLVNKGFLLHRRMPVALARIAVRNVYQRPATEYTLLTLLQKNLVDGSLYPTESKAARTSRQYSDRKVVIAGLTGLTGERSAVLEWDAEIKDEKKRDILIDLLDRSFKREKSKSRGRGE